MSMTDARDRRILGICFATMLLAALGVACLPFYSEAAEMRASWYHEGQRVACGGKRFHPDGLTAAHRSLPCGTRLKVSRGDRSVIVLINDRGPAKWTGRNLDLSRGAARRLGIIKAGVARVHMQIMR